jgi:periplasmic protein TonB
VQYLEPIALEYPRLSKRAGETGRVMIRVYIDEAGLAQNVQVYRSSAHVRLDDAALAAVQKARFKPYTENGRPVAGWAFIPIEFELEK